MKGQFLAKLSRRSIGLRKSDIAWTLIPTLLWYAAVHSRPLVIRPHCAEAPAPCTRENLLSMDQPAVGLEVGHADGLSFTTQGLSGIVALSVPPLWHLGTVILRTATPAGALLAVGTDLVLLAQTTVWNGLLTETAHLVVQRPRPFVYMDPQRAKDYSNYTSFYSGHTSFSAAATTFTTLTLAGRGAPSWLIALSAAGAYALMSLTGTYRVLAGRHFPTDVVIGALAGIAVAVLLAWRRRDAVARDSLL